MIPAMSMRGLVLLVAMATVMLAVTAGPSEAVWERDYRTLLGSRLYDVAFTREGLTVATADGIVRLDRAGVERQRQVVDTTTCYVVLAENGRYGVVEHRPNVPPFPEKITLYTQTGELIDSFPIGGAPYLSPDGDWLVTVNLFKREVSLYSERGELLRTDTYPALRDFGLRFSGNGERVVLNLPENPVRGRAVVYSRQGLKLCQIEHALGQANPGISADGRTIAVIGRTAAAIYSETGALRASFRRGNRAGTGILTADGKKLWLAEANGIRVLTVATSDSQSFTLPAEAGEVVKISEDPSGQWILVGQKREYLESGVVWTWRVYNARTETEVWTGEERTRFGYAKLGPGIVLKGIDEIEVWEHAPDSELE